MERNLLVAGFGGQGVMLLGKLLSNCACENTDKNVTFFPSSTSNFSKNTTSPSVTLYCFPQLSIIAYIICTPPLICILAKHKIQGS